MSGEDRQFWPTDSRLAELRENGIVPYGSVAALCAAALAGIAMARYLQSSFNDALEGYKILLHSGTPAESAVGALGTALMQAAVLPAFVVAAAVFVLGLLQTRFWFGASRLGLDLSQLAPRLSQLNPIRIVFRGISSLILSVAILGAAGGVTFWLFRSILPLLNGSRESIGEWLTRLSDQLSLFAVAALLILGFFAFLLSRLLFRYRHRMTKQEMEQDLRSSGS